jgi:hypothetical protein
VTMTSSRGLAVALVVSLAAAAPSGVARAQAHVPTAQELETARTLYKEGKELRAQGDLAGALEKFRAAHAVGDTPVTGIELARTYVLVRKLVEAREVALSIARLSVAGDETEKSADARTEAAKLAEDLRPRIPTLVVKLSGVAPGEVAHLSIDGAVVADVAVLEPQKVDPGKHDVAATVGDGATTREAHATADAVEGQTVEVSLVVPPAPTPTPVPAPTPALAPAPTPYRMPLLEKVGFGVAVVGGTVGLVAGSVALIKKGQLGPECNCDSCDNSKGGTSDLNAARTWANVSTVSFVVGGLGAVLGVLGLFNARGASAPAHAANVTPWIGLGEAGLNGRF